MDSLAEILGQINELKVILEAVNFKLYFDIEDVRNVEGVSQIIPLSTALVNNINLISDSPPTPIK